MLHSLRFSVVEHSSRFIIVAVVASIEVRVFARVYGNNDDDDYNWGLMRSCLVGWAKQELRLNEEGRETEKRITLHNWTLKRY